MSIAVECDEISRFSDICAEPIDHPLSPIENYVDKPLVSLLEAVRPIVGLFNRLEDNVYVALNNCSDPFDHLTVKESASICLYTMQFPGQINFCTLLNRSLRQENREELKPWFYFLKLFLTALYKLPSQNERVWRGVKNVNLTSKYPIGKKFIWWGISSCTTQLEVLQSELLLGTTGERTIFSIQCFNGKSIINHSFFKRAEKEMILMPGSYFQVIEHFKSSDQLHIIHLKELPPPTILLKPPFSKSSMTNTFSLGNKFNMLGRKISKENSSKSNLKWKQNGVTIAGGNGLGKKFDQLTFPQGFLIDDNQTIFIADWWNDRIIQWKSNEITGQILAGGNGKGNQINQLNHPTNILIDKENHSFIISDCENGRILRYSLDQNPKEDIIISDIDCVGLTMDKDGAIYLSDCVKNEIRRWKKGETYGTIIAGGNGKGDQLNQFHFPTFISIDEDYSLYISDMNNHRVMKWIKDAKEGIILAGGNGNGHRLTQLSYPEGIILDQYGQIYIADSNNDRIVRWYNGATEGIVVIGGNSKGNESNQLNTPIDLSFDRQGNLYVVDSWNHRVQKFLIDSNENHPVN